MVALKVASQQKRRALKKSRTSELEAELVKGTNY
jgi:hypothetical protein